MAKRSGSLCWFRILPLAAYLVVMPICVGISSAGDEPAAESSATTLPVEPIGAETTDTEPDKKTTVIVKTFEATHDDLEQGIYNQVIKLDNFFGNIKTENQRKTKYQIRWRSSIRVNQDGKIEFGTNLRANIQLSRINERLHFAFFGDNDPAPVSSSLPEDPGNPGLDRSSRSLHVANTELRYDLIRTPTIDLFLGAGVRLVIPPEAFVRSRFQYIHKISDVSLLRFSETLFVKNLGLLGETSEVDLEHLLNKKTLLRWSNTGTVSSEISGMEWGTELSLIRELSPRSGINFTGGVYGNTSTKDWVQNYRIFARYRQNFFRSWLFYELEPEFSWPRNPDKSFPTNYAFTFRLEVVFQGKEK